MEANPHAIRLEDLLVHAGWVRGLARSLVTDPHAAEDVVQDTWVAALRTPPREDRNLRAWLGRVVTNFARQRGRGAARRTQREGQAEAMRAPVETPEELAARVETQRRVAAVVLELDEPFRQTVLLRYYEGLSSAEIARRIGAPAGTVRWRLSRGLELLRERLDDDYGSRRAWSALLVPLARLEVPHAEPTGSGLSALLQGILAMNLALKVSIAVVAVVLVATLTPLGTLAVGLLSGLDAYDAEPVEVTFRPVEQPATTDVAIAGVDEGTTRVEVQVPAEEVAPPPPTTGVALRVLDAQGQPVSGVPVYLLSEYGNAVTTDTAGRVTVPFHGETDRRYSHDVLVDDPRFLLEQREVTLRTGEIVSLGDIRLQTCGAVEGIVIDTAGRPVAGAEVAYGEVQRNRAELRSKRLRQTADGISSPRNHNLVDMLRENRTGEDGRFHLRRVPVGMHMVWAGAEGHLANHTAPVEVRAESVSEGVVVELGVPDPEDFIRGVVLDPAGQPVPRANIQVEYKSWLGSGSRSGSADQEGRFLFAYTPDTPRTIRASDREGRWSAAVATGVRGGAADLVLQLTEPVWMSVTVLGTEGSVEGAAVAAYDPDHRRNLVSSLQVVMEGGAYRFAVPDESFLVHVECDGYDVETVGPFPGTAAPTTLTVRLRALPGVRGRVIANGDPVEGATLELQRVARGAEEVNGFPVRVQGFGHPSDPTGDDGTFALTLRESGAYFLRAEAAGFAPTELGPLRIDVEQGLDGLEIELGPGGAIEGRVLMPNGGSPAGVIVAISRGDAHAVSRRVDEDGVFHFAHLTPGAWSVVRRDEEISRSSSSSFSDGNRRFDESSIVTNCFVVEGETTAFDLDLAGSDAGVVLAGTLTLDGAGAHRWEVQLAPANMAAFQRDPSLAALVDERGSFRIVAPDAMPYRLLLTSPDGSVILSATVELFPGLNPWSHAFATGTLVVENPAPLNETGMPLGFYLAEVEGVHILAAIQPGEDGTARIEGLPASGGRIVSFTLEQMASLSEFPTDQPGIANAVIRAGEVTKVRLPE